MLVNCPRCGFSQPQDQYCARCGVDMLSFVPSRKPFLFRFFGSTPVQVSFLLALVVGLFAAAQHFRQKEIMERVAEIENAGSTRILSMKSTLQASETEPQAPNAKAELASAAPPPADGGAAAAGAPPTGNARALTPPAPAGAAAASASPSVTASAGSAESSVTTEERSVRRAASATALASQVQITFVEVTRTVATELAAAADRRSSSLQGPVGVAVVPTAFANAKIKAAQSMGQWEILDATTRPVRITQPAEFYGGQREEASGQFLGFVVEAIPLVLDEAESRLELKIWRYLRDGASGQTEEFSVPLPEQLSIPRNSSLLIMGSALLPRRISEAERAFYEPLKVLQILSSEAYRQGNSEILIMIEAH